MTPSIIWAGAAAGNFSPGRPAGFRPEAIVIHVMDGTFAGTRAWFNNVHAKVSAHFGIAKGGAVEQYVKESDTAFHAGVVAPPLPPAVPWPGLKPQVNPNFYTIGIEHEGRGDDPGWPAAQLAASGALVADIARRWVIPIDGDHIIPHHAIRASKSCPGNNRSVTALIDAARQNAPPPPPAADPALVAGVGDRTVLALVNVRRLPDPSSLARGILQPGATFPTTGAVLGQPVANNPLWYVNAAGEYLWAGATDRPMAG
jgi:N-acetylmuramoyl-L-alanine amidase